MAQATGSVERVLALKGKYKRDNKLDILPSKSSWKNDVTSSTGKLISTFPYLNEFVNFASIAYKDHKKAASTQCSSVRLDTGDLSLPEGQHSSIKIASDQESPQQADNLNVRLLNRFSRRAGKLFNCLRSKETVCEVPLIKFSNVKGIPQGFVILAEATNRSAGNGYYGVAYIHADNMEIVVSHRGTKLSNLGALKTDLMSIFLNSHTPQVSSAMTFAHKVIQFAQEIGCQVFFTGHSLGAWLAQITCFSAKYLTIDQNSDHFLRKPVEQWDDVHPYTVVFDSPGALQFLQKMKDDLFPRNEPQSQEVNVACLPVEVYQFFPNTVNKQNIQIGSVFMVDFDKAEVKYSYVVASTKLSGTKLRISKPISTQTHPLDPVANLISTTGENNEQEVLRSQVIDCRIKNWNDFLHKWDQNGTSIQVQLNRFPTFFLKSKELDFLKEMKTKSKAGSYEGVCFEEEEAANNLVELARVSDLLQNGTIQLGMNLDRREFIPIIRHTVKMFKNGRIWWNERKPQLPSNYIERRVCRSSKFYSDGSLPPTAEKINLVELNEDFVLLVNPPGMGKSIEMTHLEQKLRKKVNSYRIILRVNLNEVQKALSSISSESVFSVLIKLAPFLPLETLQMEEICVFVLLDGLDEVCPRHQMTMINLLRILKPTESTDLQERQLSVVVTTRPHLRDAIEYEFDVESWSLAPLSMEDQITYIQAELGMSIEELIYRLNQFQKSLLGLLTNPLMLSMLVDILKSGENLSAISNLNIYDLYSRFVEAKHKLQLVQKESMRPEDSFTEIRLESTLARNLPFYFHVAWNQLLRGSAEDTRDNFLPPAFKEQIGNFSMEPSPKSVVTELLISGLLIETSEGKLRFKHRSFAEFFYARLLTHQEAPQAVRDTLFYYIYSLNYMMENVEAFVAAAITTKDSESLQLPLTTKWFLIKGFIYRNYRLLPNFVTGSLFPILVREVLMTFVG